MRPLITYEEAYSADGTCHIKRTPKLKWRLTWKGVELKDFDTREQARKVIRFLRKNWKL